MALTGQRVIHDLRATLFAHLLRLEAGFFDRTPVGRLMTRVLNDVEAVSEAFTSGLFAIVADVVTLAGVVAVMLWMDWRLALVTFAIVPVLFLVAGYFRIRARDAYREVRRRLARLNAFLQGSIQGPAVIQLVHRPRGGPRRLRGSVVRLRGGALGARRLRVRRRPRRARGAGGDDRRGEVDLRAAAEPHVGRGARTRAGRRRGRARVGPPAPAPAHRGDLPGSGALHRHGGGEPRGRRERRPFGGRRARAANGQRRGADRAPAARPRNPARRARG